ncbi:hypothetical protein [Streptomyces coeruleorubidus]|uniref:hypothetical protein n=1 Tax=Streptomyces coeruleorubidus TaxID=116188 RepID=UPI0036A77B58
MRSALDDTIQAFGRLDAAFDNAAVEQPVKSAADIMLWRCSDAACFATGHALVVDGGQTV